MTKQKGNVGDYGSMGRMAQHFENVNAEPPWRARHGKWFIIALVVVLAFAAGAMVSRALEQAALDAVAHEEVVR